MRIPYSWLNQFLPASLPIKELEDVLTRGIAEVEGRESVDGDEVLQLELKPDRGDCLCVEGVAREAAALADIAYGEPAFNSPRSPWKVEHAPPGGTEASASGVPIRIDAPDLCPRYAACVMEGIHVAPSPQWLQERIRQVGLRPVNNVVDATNFVMFEMGQPLHAFDLDRLAGPTIIVRRAAIGERLEAINGQPYELSTEAMVIADSEKPVAIAGVMGGLESEVSASTTRILLESAHFNPVSVRMTARRLGLKSDASYRFERGVDPSGCVRALARVASIIEDVAGGHVAGPIADVYPAPVEERTIRLRPDRVQKLLGMAVAPEEIEGALRRLSLGTVWDGADLVVTAPTRRPDLAIEEDLVEEVARVLGYDHVPASLPVATSTPGGLIPERRVAEMVRDALAGAGYTEIRSYSLTGRASLLNARCGEPFIHVRNAISADRDLLRPLILPSLLDAAGANLGLGFRDQHLFEIGRVFTSHASENGIVERTHVGGFAMGNAWISGWNMDSAALRSDFYAVRGALDNLASALRLCFTVEGSGNEAEGGVLAPPGALHPGRWGSVYLDGKPVGFLGELHPYLIAQFGFTTAPVVFELEMEPLIHAHEKASRRPVDMEFYRHPAATRDMALAIKQSVPAAEILKLIRETSSVVTDAKIFDVYRGPGLEPGDQSIAISLELRSPGRTMTDVEANGVIDSLVSALADRYGARRR
ncbi:MAG: phenylalanine--tRNA ligase subunit beta [Armatimonadota bacterium]|nr:phenylalanine--tRNA ligase subunit beta [Armatimonadota bacterium]